MIAYWVAIYCFFIGKQIFHFWFCEQRGDNKGGKTQFFVNWCWLNNSTNVAAYTFTPTLLFCILLRKESEKEFNSSQFDWEQGEDAGKED